MTERIYSENLQKPIDYSRLIQAFGSMDLTRQFIGHLSCMLIDPHGVIFMHGSFVNGHCLNPTSGYSLRPPDEGRRSDVDLGMADAFLFREIPKNERIKSVRGIVPPEASAKMTYPVTFKDGRVKEYTKRNEIFIYDLIEILQQQINRRIDLKFYQDISVWYMFLKPYWVLADKQRLYF